MGTIGNTLLLIAAPLALLCAPALSTRGPLLRVRAVLSGPVRRLLQACSPQTTGHTPFLRSNATPAPSKDLAWHCAYGVILAGSAVGTAVVCARGPLAAVNSTSQLTITLGTGTLLGIALVALCRHLREAVIALRCARQLSHCGVTGTWTADPATRDRGLPFDDALLQAAADSEVVDVIDTDALAALTSLSHPAHADLEAPHPNLHGTRLRLLVVPLRCNKIDPERKRSSCAEEALARAAVAPEHQWQRLQQLQQVQHQWRAEFSTEIEVRFVEDRPCTHLVSTDSAAWFRPWVSDGQVWTEVRSAHESDTGSLHSVLRDSFLSAWADATPEPAYNAPPQGSTFVVKKPQPATTTLRIVTTG